MQLPSGQEPAPPRAAAGPPAPCEFSVRPEALAMLALSVFRDRVSMWHHTDRGLHPIRRGPMRRLRASVHFLPGTPPARHLGSRPPRPRERGSRPQHRATSEWTAQNSRPHIPVRPGLAE